MRPMLLRLRRAAAFGYHIPPAKLLRRLYLSLRRRWRDRTGWPADEGGEVPALSATPPLPLFSPRRGMVAASGGRFAFTFLGRPHQMADTMDWNAPGQGPEYQLWRMHLHYMEYLEEAGVSDFTALVLDWMAANQPMRAGRWRDSWNAYALSLRVVVWMQQIARHRASLPPAALAGMLASLAGQLRFLAENLETDIGGNHLVKNIKALLWASAFFQGAEAESWRRLGLKWLKKALREQILADGMHYERSPSYHAQVFADLLECRHALPQAQCPAALPEALRGMAQAVADLCHPDGFAAQFNDSGLNMAYAPGECLQAFEILFHSRPLPRPAFTLFSAGYFGLRSGESCFVADCGRIAPDDLPAHGHGDILSFEWSVAGRRIIVDQGVFEYIPGALRAQSRSAAAHNTLCFAGADQADFFGAFRIGRRPKVRVERCESSDGHLLLEGWHNGFGRLPGSSRHWRRFEVTPGQIIITDRIGGRSKTGTQIGFLLHPDVDILRQGAHLRLSAGAAIVTLQSSAEISLEPAVWWPDMGVERNTLRASIKVACGVREVITVLRVEKPAPGAAPEVA